MIAPDGLYCLDVAHNTYAVSWLEMDGVGHGIGALGYANLQDLSLMKRNSHFYDVFIDTETHQGESIIDMRSVHVQWNNYRELCLLSILVGWFTWLKI